jgi:hypothetical protein
LFAGNACVPAGTTSAAMVFSAVKRIANEFAPASNLLAKRGIIGQSGAV